MNVIIVAMIAIVALGLWLTSGIRVVRQFEHGWCSGSAE